METAAKPARLRVLIIEDDPDHAALIKGYFDVLHGRPIDWEWVDRLEAGLARLRQNGIDVVLLDLRLPDSSMEETLPRLVEHAGHLPIIVLTALNDTALGLQAVQQGAQDYLVKTQISSDTLLRTIQYAVERKRYAAELEAVNQQLRREAEERRKVEAALRAGEAQLRTLNATLERHVGARTAELAQANEVLAQRNRELQDFAYVASHDLQEPLRKIRAFSGLLQAEYGSALDEQARMYLARLTDASERMATLMEDLLTYSRVGTRGSSFEPVDLGRVAAEVLAHLAPRIEETQARVEVAALPTIEADASQMRRLLNNLVDNALKFRSPERPPVVRIDAALDPAVDEPAGGDEPARLWCRIVVEDNGIGFEEKFLDRIFAPFQRLHGRAAYGGTGIGLAICRRIAEHHGGSITAGSRLGQGSRFVVLLPAEQRGRTAQPL